VTKRVHAAANLVFDAGEPTMLDVVDALLNQGVVVDGDATIGVAGVDLIYLGLSALLGAADRVVPRVPVPRRPPDRRRRTRSPKVGR